MSSSVPKRQPQLAPKKSFWDAIDRFIQSVPPEEFKKLPADGSINLDHYLYGTPKIQP